MPRKQKPQPSQEQIDDILGKKHKSKTIYEKEINAVDFETGEVTEQQKTVVKTTTKEPDFIKLYYGTMCAFRGVENIPIDFICELSNYLLYANARRDQMTITLGMFQRQQIAKNLNCSIDSVNKYIKKCVESQIIFKTEFRATYIANPFLIARGDWNTIRDLRAAFDFKNGVWSYNQLRELTDDGNVVESKTVTQIESKQSRSQMPQPKIEQIEFTDHASFDAIVKEMQNAAKQTSPD